MATWKKVVVESAADTIAQSTTGNAATATALETARTIGGVSFNGTANINLPGVNASGTQDTSGNAATATALETQRAFSISGDITAASIDFNGTGNVALSATIDNDVVDAAALNVTGNGTSGQLLSSDGDGSFTWINAASGTLSGLSDTNIATPSANQILQYDGAEWDNITIGGDLTVVGTSFRVSSVQPNAVTLGTSTTGNYVATIAGTTNEIEVTGSGSETAAVTIGLPNDVTIGNNLTVTGDLTVSGTTTTINTTNLEVEDQFVLLNNAASATDADAGIVVEGSTKSVAFGYDQSADRWAFDKTGATSSMTAIGNDAYFVHAHTAAGDSTNADSDFAQYGNIYVDSSSQDIYIYS